GPWRSARPLSQVAGPAGGAARLPATARPEGDRPLLSRDRGSPGGLPAPGGTWPTGAGVRLPGEPGVARGAAGGAEADALRRPGAPGAGAVAAHPHRPPLLRPGLPEPRPAGAGHALLRGRHLGATPHDPETAAPGAAHRPESSGRPEPGP